MKKRRLGSTELKVSEVGFGTWRLGSSAFWGTMSDSSAHSLVSESLDSGCTLFDTAPNYSDSNSERLLGEALQGHRDDVVLVSKIGHGEDGGPDFSDEWFWKSLHGSLQRLKTDYLDVYLLHSPPVECQHPAHPVWDALRQAQAQGKIRYFGASVDSADEVDMCLEAEGLQILEVMFNILHQDVRRSFAAVRERGVGLLAKVPLDSGWLGGSYHANSRFVGVRDRWSKEDIQRRSELINQLVWLTEGGATLAQQALSYLLAYSEVSCVIPGACSIDQLKFNLSASKHVMSPTDRAKLEVFWDTFTQEGKCLLPW